MLAFFSYSHIDAESEGALIGEIHAELEKKTRAAWGSRSFDIWRDVDDLRWGTTWSRAIGDAISTCDLFVLLLSPGWLRSSFCRQELEAFKRREQALGSTERILIAQILEIPRALLDGDAECRALVEELGARQRKMWLTLADSAEFDRMKLYRDAAGELAQLLFAIPPPAQSRALVAAEPLVAAAPAVAATPGGAVADTPALAIGSQLVGFAAEVPSDLRQSVAESLLFAQLAADQADPQGRWESKDWVTKYVSVLATLGWSIAGQSAMTLSIERGIEDAREQLKGILLALCPPPAHEQLQAMLQEVFDARADSESPGPQLFLRHSRVIDGARFFVSHVGARDAGPVELTVLAVRMTGQMETTAVLFFKSNALLGGTIEVQRFKLRLQRDVFDSVKDVVAKRVSAHAQEYIAGIDL